MIKVSVMYPNTEGSTFDITYYCDRHIPLVLGLLGTAVKGAAVDQGIGGSAPGSPAPYLALGHLFFESVEAFQASFDPHAQVILGDIPNYTNTQPIIQVSEVRLDTARVPTSAV
ncbi:MAG: EthD family reductase [Planctomycetaceae bacterium]|nr:EthD family reductase [Planctomycetaceae bacterium]